MILNDDIVLNDNQWGALTSLTYSLSSCEVLRYSALARCLNLGENPDMVANQAIPKFDRVNGHVSLQVARRRVAEDKLFTTDSQVEAHPMCEQ